MMTDARSGWDLIPDWVTTIFTVAAIILAVGLGFGLGTPPDRLTTAAQGTVSRVEKQRKTHVTFVRFEDGDHQVHEAQSVINDSSKRFQVGDVLTVYYDPRDPEAGCLIDGDEGKSAFGQVAGLVCRLAGGVGVLVTVGAGVYFRFVRRASE